jgi:hypothetical protein
MAAHEYDTPEEVITYATGGRLTKHALASLLTARAKRPFLDACATIELKYQGLRRRPLRRLFS